MCKTGVVDVKFVNNDLIPSVQRKVRPDDILFSSYYCIETCDLLLFIRLINYYCILYGIYLKIVFYIIYLFTKFIQNLTPAVQ